MCINNTSLFLAYQSINWWQNSIHILLKLNGDSLFITQHISATLHLTIFGIWSYNIQSVQYAICGIIVRGLWNIGLAIRYTIWIVAHLCTSRGTFLCINGKTTLSPLDATAARRWRCSSCESQGYCNMIGSPDIGGWWTLYSVRWKHGFWIYIQLFYGHL